MQDCKSVDPENRLLYDRVISEVIAEQAMRLENYIYGHGLYEKFIEEDKTGKRSDH
jgi:hypothetical protein